MNSGARDTDYVGTPNDTGYKNSPEAQRPYMLLIVGKHTDRLQNIHLVEARSQLPLRVAHNAAALRIALSQSRRNVLLLTEPDVTAEAAEVLDDFSDEPNLHIVVVQTADKPSTEAAERLDSIENLIWLGADVSEDDLVNCVRQCKETMFRVTADEIEAAFANSELLVQYQPKIQWLEKDASWRTTEAEALIRWKHPEHQVLLPRHFLPEIQQYGFMAQLSEYVLENTLQQLERWANRGLILNGCINLSPEMLDVPGLAETYKKVVVNRQLDCSRISFEFPTPKILEGSRKRIDSIDALRDAGFRVSLDDFGSTQNCMEAFEIVRFDEIKLHGSLLKSAQTDIVKQQSLAALTGMAQNLDIAVCAEGVETDEMFAFVQEIRCNRMQGYLVSAAVMPEIIQSYYASPDQEQESTYVHFM